MNSNSPLQELNAAIDRVLEVSVCVRVEFFHKLTLTNDVTPITPYRQQHSARDEVNDNDEVQHWLSRANCNGEISQVRPVMKPRMNHGKTSRSESMAGC